MKKKILFILMIFLVMNLVQAEKVLLLDLTIKFDSANIDKIRVFESDFVKETIAYDPENIFLLSAVVEGQETRTVYFQKYLIEMDHPPKIVDEIYYTLYLPYEETDNNFVLEKHGEEFASYDLTLLCNLDNKCNNEETYLSCPSECSPDAEDGYCNYYLGKDQCDPDCDVDLDCLQGSTGKVISDKKTISEKKPLLFVLSVIIIIVLVILAVFIVKKMGKKVVTQPGLENNQSQFKE